MSSEDSLPLQPDLKRQASKAASLPGVYLMRDQHSDVIYVGKAKNLRARLRSYFTGSDERVFVDHILSKCRRIETIVTENENQAFILERDLISKYKPRFNIKLKDDKAYLNIRIDLNAEWPKLELVRRVQDDGALYFGPYSFSYELRSLLDTIKSAIPLRTCTDTVFYNRQRPCLEYQIGRCAGPCCLSVDRQLYMQWVEQAIKILQGRSEDLVKELHSSMEAAAKNMNFEAAALLRDRIRVLCNSREQQIAPIDNNSEQAVFGLYREAALASVTVLRVLGGRIADTYNFSFDNVCVDDQELLDAALGQFFESGRELSHEVILPFETDNTSLIQDVFSERFKRKVEFVVPQRGSRFRLLQLAQLNAKQHFISAFEAQDKALDLMKELARTLKLKQIPRRIECVDVSNLQGSDIVGALAVFFDGLPDKKSYKRYLLSLEGKPDDFAGIYEVVNRRLERGKQEGDLPDLMIIDGGPLQLAKALEAREKHKLNVEMLALAKMRPQKSFSAARHLKKPERIYTEGAKLPLSLNPNHPITHFLQRIRDEAHRFVITFHRQRRSKRVFASALDKLPGIGPARKKVLLQKFGSVDRIKQLSAEELSKAAKVSPNLAKKLLRALN